MRITPEQFSRGNRRGRVFALRLSDDERAYLEALRKKSKDGPQSLGPWIVWRAMCGSQPPRGGTTRAPVIPNRSADLSIKSRVILDLCGGSGSWSAPYRKAGYDVRVITLPKHDVRTFVPPARVHGVLAAPPCTEFSIATNGRVGRGYGERDFVEGMACVNACMRIVLQCRPKWWALENPTGLLARWLGRPRDTWEPCDFGDAWTKATSIWGDFQLPRRGPFVKPRGSAATRSTAAARAITPPGFARAFFEANP